ncbi:MAG: hypothetical protein A2V88_03230 [Elusimicrobia bacterium RBG_16_66_12]|nr:MAG: hypothetical protein A2V88_03230 [Elusimicrobia bacterium RBG_16_66_12]
MAIFRSTWARTRRARANSGRSMYSRGVWSRDDSPGPQATAGQDHAGTTMFMSAVPDFRTKDGSPPCEGMAARKTRTRGEFFSPR